MKYVEQFGRYFMDEKAFSFRDAKRFMKRYGSTDAYTKLFIHNLLATGKITKIGKGGYTFSKNEEVIGFAFSPFYYGLEYALTIRGLWTQISSPVIITNTKARSGVRTISGKRVVIRRISDKMFFGFDHVKYSGIFVPVSDLEKTIVDLMYYKIGIENGEVTKLVEKADRNKLRMYARRMSIVPAELRRILE